MTSRNLSRWLERLEQQLVPIIEEPFIIVVKYVTTDGEVSEAYRSQCLTRSQVSGIGSNHEH